MRCYLIGAVFFAVIAYATAGKATELDIDIVQEGYHRVQLPDGSLLSDRFTAEHTALERAQRESAACDCEVRILYPAKRVRLSIPGVVQLTWQPPTARLNGAAMGRDEISRFTLYWAPADASDDMNSLDIDSSQTGMRVQLPAAGRYVFALTATDTAGFTSAPSPLVYAEL